MLQSLCALKLLGIYHEDWRNRCCILFHLEVPANGLVCKRDAKMSVDARVLMCMSGMCAFTFGDAQKVSFSCRTDRPCGRQREREGGSGLGVVVHLGWSASHCGKTQYLHFVIRTAFTLSFSTTRIYTHLTGEGGSVGPNVLHLFITARRSGQRCMCVCDDDAERES